MGYYSKQLQLSTDYRAHIQHRTKKSWLSLSCLSGPFCSVSKMFCYNIVGARSTHVT